MNSLKAINVIIRYANDTYMTSLNEHIFVTGDRFICDKDIQIKVRYFKLLFEPYLRSYA